MACVEQGKGDLRKREGRDGRERGEMEGREERWRGEMEGRSGILYTAQVISAMHKLPMHLSCINTK